MIDFSQRESEGECAGATARASYRLMHSHADKPKMQIDKYMYIDIGRGGPMNE